MNSITSNILIFIQNKLSPINTKIRKQSMDKDYYNKWKK
jgi:hypothetical protein